VTAGSIVLAQPGTRFQGLNSNLGPGLRRGDL